MHPLKLLIVPLYFFALISIPLLSCSGSSHDDDAPKNPSNDSPVALTGSLVLDQSMSADGLTLNAKSAFPNPTLAYAGEKIWKWHVAENGSFATKNFQVTYGQDCRDSTHKAALRLTKDPLDAFATSSEALVDSTKVVPLPQFPGDVAKGDYLVTFLYASSDNCAPQSASFTLTQHITPAIAPTKIIPPPPAVERVTDFDTKLVGSWYEAQAKTDCGQGQGPHCGYNWYSLSILANGTGVASQGFCIDPCAFANTRNFEAGVTVKSLAHPDEDPFLVLQGTAPIYDDNRMLCRYKSVAIPIHGNVLEMTCSPFFDKNSVFPGTSNAGPIVWVLHSN